ncbi:MAG: hypothetical protein JSR54_00850 [Proteobacteria bacterium]|nr:hypothetical protein [Pseudomonadota bacterium]
MLEKNGSIMLAEDLKDGRACYVALRHVGPIQFRAMVSQHEDRIFEMFSGLIGAEMRRLVTLLGKARDTARRIAARRLGSGRLVVAARLSAPTSPRRAARKCGRCRRIPHSDVLAASVNIGTHFASAGARPARGRVNITAASSTPHPIGIRLQTGRRAASNVVVPMPRLVLSRFAAYSLRSDLHESSARPEWPCRRRLPIVTISAEIQ